MKKIPTLFVRQMDGRRRLITDRIALGCDWVAAGEGAATRKIDGTCCLVRGGRLYKRHEIQATGAAAPTGWEPAAEPDPETGKQPGWVPVGDGPEDRWHREALASEVEARAALDNAVFRSGAIPDGTYELIGPKVQGNPERADRHLLVPHGSILLPGAPRDYAGLRAYLAAAPIEGIVWWRDPADPDCDKAKIKVRDFGLSRTVPAAPDEDDQ